MNAPYPNSPYKGLMPFAAEDAPFFFGREPEREIITANLLATRLTVLYGTSGVGKSSVLQAGVAHHLDRLSETNLAEHGMPLLAVVVCSSWRDDPIATLAHNIQDAVARAWRGHLPDPAASSPSLTQTVSAWTERVNGHLLLILDQFEEYFLYHPYDDGPGTFAYEFPDAINNADLRARFLISLREDALAKLDRFKGRIPNLFDNYLRIEHLDRDAARTAIEQPLAYYNRVYAGNGHRVSIEPALVQAMLEQVATGQVVLGDAGRGVAGLKASAAQVSGRVEAPYLQLVLTRLWDEEIRAGSHVLSLAVLEDLGGAENIVRTHLDSAMAALKPDEQDVAARIFHHLVTPSGTKIAYTSDDLAAYAEIPVARLTRVMERLAGGDSRILRPVAPPPDQPLAPRYEIYHDVLAPAVLDWRARYVQDQRVREAEEQKEREQHERETVRQAKLEQAQLIAREQQRVAELERQRAEEQARLVRRLRRQALLLVLVSLFVVGLAVFAVNAASSARKAQQAAQIGAQTAIASEKDASVAKQTAVADRNIALSQALNLQALARTKGAQLDLALLLSVEAVRLHSTSEARTILANHVERYRRLIAFLHGQTSTVLGMAYRGHTLASIGANGALVTWDVVSRRQRSVITLRQKHITATAFSPRGLTLALGQANGAIQLWDGVRGIALGPALAGHSGAVRHLVFSADGRLLASSGADGTVRLWSLSTRHEQILAKRDSVTDGLAFSPDGTLLASGDAHGRIQVWDIVHRRSVGQHAGGHSSAILALAFSRNGRMLASADASGEVDVWDPGHLSAPSLSASAPANTITTLAFGSRNQFLVWGTAEGNIWLWNMARQHNLSSINALSSGVTSMAFSPDGSVLATGGVNAEVELWDMNPTHNLDLTVRIGSVQSVSFSSDSHVMAAGGDLGRVGVILLWNVAQRRPLLPPLVERHGTVTSVAFSPDGTVLASASAGGTIQLWDVASHRPLDLPLATFAAPVESVAFSPSGKILASGGDDGSVRLWDVAQRRSIGAPLMDHTGAVTSVAFSSNGKILAAGEADGSVRLWDVLHRRAIGTALTGHQAAVESVAFSANGKILASGSLDRTVRLWDLTRGRPFGTPLTGPLSGIHSVSLSPDGQTVAAGSADNGIWLWDIQTQQPNFIPVSYHSVLSVAFSPNGATLGTGSDDGLMREWDFDPQTLQQRACLIANRNLSRKEFTQYLGSLPYHKTCSL